MATNDPAISAGTGNIVSVQWSSWPDAAAFMRWAGAEGLEAFRAYLAARCIRVRHDDLTALLAAIDDDMTTDNMPDLLERIGRLKTAASVEAGMPPDQLSVELQRISSEYRNDEAFAGIHKIARACGLFSSTMHAQSIGEVCDQVAAWCEQARSRERARDGLVDQLRAVWAHYRDDSPGQSKVDEAVAALMSDKASR